MKALIDGSIRYPTSTAAGVILVLFLGVVALLRIPVQLTPTVEQPQIRVTTAWPTGGPLEVEREIIAEQEKYLKEVKGLVRLESQSLDGQGIVTLTFAVGTEIDAALLRVSNRLQQVRSYPPDAERPVLATVDNQGFAMIWYAIVAGQTEQSAPFAGDVRHLTDFAEDTLRPAFERLQGVATVDVSGGLDKEMQVLVDPERLAAHRVTIPELLLALDRDNRNITGGDVDEGKRRFMVRTVGEYRSPEDVEEVVIALRRGVPVHVRDVARVELGFSEPRQLAFWMGEPALLLGIHRELGSNTLEIAERATEVAQRLESQLLAPRGLRLLEVRNETRYLGTAIDLVRQNLIFGALLAVTVLLLFLRSAGPTLIVAIAIPISVLGTFFVLWIFGRSFNVISLAGMAFAIGMVIDNAIVVLEAIDRRRGEGASRADAARLGAEQVWGAVLASTLTTVAVFRDLALAISAGLLVSLAVSVTVIPALAARLFRRSRKTSSDNDDSDNDVGDSRERVASLPERLGKRLGDRIGASVYWLCGTTLRRLAVVLVLSGAAVGLSVWLMPKVEYLPGGNRNFVFGMVSAPSGYNLGEVLELRHPFVEQLGPLVTDEIDPDLPGGGIWNLFFVVDEEGSRVVMNARDPARVRELIPKFYEVTASIPGVVGGMAQSTIFAGNIARRIDIEITGPDFTHLTDLGLLLEERLRETLPDVSVQPGSIDLSHPELQVVPHRRRAAELGLSSRDLGFVVAALIDGVKASEVLWEGREIDLKVRAATALDDASRLEQLPIATPDGRLVTLGSVAEVTVTHGPTSISHLEQDRFVTVRVVPPEGEALQATMERIEESVLAPLRRDGTLGSPYSARLSGSADKLTQTWSALQWNFLLAVVLTYLLMTALFRSFVYPLVILFSVPLAALGGFLGLALLNVFTFQALDVLTMLGFIILVGTVVNNAILIVHEALLHLREDGSDPREAIRRATRSRVRPIFMSTLTSVFGMLPLVLFPGAGSELYRGLGTVVVGGLALSTVFTLFLIPALLSLVLDAERGMRRMFGD